MPLLPPRRGRAGKGAGCLASIGGSSGRPGGATSTLHPHRLSAVKEGLSGPALRTRRRTTDPRAGQPASGTLSLGTNKALLLRQLLPMASSPASDPNTAQPLAAVIVAAYNADGTLDATLASVLRQTEPRWECWVVDDGSTDGTVAVARRWSERDLRFRVLAQKNAGPSAARNRALRQVSASVRYCWFLDADDELMPDALGRTIAYLEQNPQVVTVGVGFEELLDDGTVRPGHRSRFVPAFPIPRDLKPHERATPFVTFLCCTGMGAFALHRRDALERCGGYDERLWSHEDADLFCRMALEGEVHYLPDVLYRRRVVPGSLTHVGQQRGGGELFHRKWLDYRHPDPSKQRIIDQARRHYYRVHVPLRDLKVASKSLREFLRTREVAKLRWTLKLVAHALRSPWSKYGA